MDQSIDEPGRVASEYLQRHGGEAIIYIDGDIAKALGTHRWEDYKLLQRARLRLRRMELFEQISFQMRSRFGRPPERMTARSNLFA